MRGCEEVFVGGVTTPELQIAPNHFLMVFAVIDQKVGLLGHLVYEVRDNKFINRFFSEIKDPMKAASDYKRSVF